MYYKAVLHCKEVTKTKYNTARQKFNLKWGKRCMTSREKVTAAINHQPYKGIAIDFGAMRSTGIHAVAYANFCT